MTQLINKNHYRRAITAGCAAVRGLSSEPQAAFPMRIITVPHTGQMPFVAGFPFFSVTGFGSFISRFVLHFTQYASMEDGST